MGQNCLPLLFQASPLAVQIGQPLVGTIVGSAAQAAQFAVQEGVLVVEPWRKVERVLWRLGAMLDELVLERGQLLEQSLGRLVDLQLSS